MRFVDFDGITVDAHGTLLTLENPVAELANQLTFRGIRRSPEAISNAVRAEIDYYQERMLDGDSSASLHRLRLECCRVFLDALEADLDAGDFLTDFLASLRFRVEQGVAETLQDLRARGLLLAVVSNWDCSLTERLNEVGLLAFFDVVTTSAEIGAAKPDPRIFRKTLARLSLAPERALHVGDGEADRIGALAAGMRFAPAPLATVFEGWE